MRVSAEYVKQIFLALGQGIFQGFCGVSQKKKKN